MNTRTVFVGFTLASLGAIGIAFQFSSRAGVDPACDVQATAGAKAGNSKRYGFTARPKHRTSKRG